MNSKLPLCVDLDGTLLNTDSLHELLLTFIKQNPLQVFLLPGWLLKGKAAVKHELGKRAQLNPETLPYNRPFLDFLQKEHAAGRRLLLTTAANTAVAEPIAKHLGIFESVVASDDKTNSSAEHKAAAIAAKLGEAQFAYAGNSTADLPVWKKAAAAIVVNASSAVTEEAKKLTTIEKIFPREQIKLSTWLKQIRIHQWVKNILVFVPIVTAHQFTSLDFLHKGFIAFFSFCFVASSIYILNDLLDLDSDRKHATKKYRPLAAGKIPVAQGLAVMIILFLLGITLGLSLPNEFILLLFTYLIVNIAYSFYLKRVPIIDVIVLASLYTLRLLAGGAATEIQTSSWLFVFTLFLFLSLALLKRYTEVTGLKAQNKEKAHGRGYVSGDDELLSTLGMCSGYISLLVLALYISSNDVTHLYNRPLVLWLLLPVAMFWISRTWLLAHRGDMHEDPILYAMKDKTSYLAGIAALIITLLAV